MTLGTIKKIIKEQVHQRLHEIHSKGGGIKGKEGAKGQETEGDSHPINMARKAIGLGASVTINHHNKEKTSMDPKMAHQLLDRYGKLHKPAEKEHMIHQIWHSPEGLHDYLKGKMHHPKKTVNPSSHY